LKGSSPSAPSTSYTTHNTAKKTASQVNLTTQPSTIPSPTHKKTVIFLHGGPGGCTKKSNTNYFNPSIYRVVLLDQRGTGKSQPAGEVRDNTTLHLITDIETLRLYLQIPKWHLIFGGSWGSTLALLYAQTYPQSVGSLILRGIFTTRRSEIEWSRGPLGAACFFPEAYEAFVTHLPECEREDLVKGYYARLVSKDHGIRVGAARAWNAWEMSIGSLVPDQDGFAQLEDEKWSLAHALMEAHYAVNGFWLEDGQILKEANLEKIKHMPGTSIVWFFFWFEGSIDWSVVVIVQGRYDLVCPPQTAWELGKALPKARVIFVRDAGHGAKVCGVVMGRWNAC
jgi:proline iminopeptidase